MRSGGIFKLNESKMSYAKRAEKRLNERVKEIEDYHKKSVAMALN